MTHRVCTEVLIDRRRFKQSTPSTGAGLTQIACTNSVCSDGLSAALLVAESCLIACCGNHTRDDLHRYESDCADHRNKCDRG